MKKRFIALFLSMAMFLLLLPMPVLAVDVTSGGSASTAAELNAILGGEHIVSGDMVTLNADVQVFNAGFVISGGNLTLDLAGHKIESSYVTIFTILSGASLTIMDSSSAGSGKISAGSGDSSLYGVYVNGGSLTVNSGNIESYGNGADSSGVYLGAGTVIINGGSLAYRNSTATVGAGLTIYNGTATISGGSLTGMFGIIFAGSGTANINGNVSISGTTGIQNEFGTVNISGGTVTGTAQAMNVLANGIINVSGTAMINNTLRIGGGSFSMTGGTVNSPVFVTGGIANISGGNINELRVQGGSTSISNSIMGQIQSFSGELTISGGSFTDGLTVNDTAKVNITGGTISDANYGIMANGGETTITGGTISGTTAGFGTGVYINGGKVTISGGFISGNSARLSDPYASLYITGGELHFLGIPGKTAEISNNYAYPEVTAPNYLKIAGGTVAISPSTKVKIGAANYTKYLLGGSITNNIYEEIKITAIDPNISIQPQNVSVVNGNTANFSVTATGFTAISYQWQESANGTDWANVTDGTGATTASYTTDATTITMNGYQYRCMLTNTEDVTISDAAELDVMYIPEITAQPVSASVTAGGTATFSLTAIGNPSPTYQWQVSSNGVDWTDVMSGTGATTASYTTGTTTVGMNGYSYRCVVTNSVGSDSSDLVKLYVSAAPTVPNESSDSTNTLVVVTTSNSKTIPEITTQPENAEVALGSSALFSLVAIGNPSPAYQWQVSTNGADWTDVMDGTGAQTATYTTIPTINDMNGYQYRCVVTNSKGSVISSVVSLSTQVVMVDLPSTYTMDKDGLVTWSPQPDNGLWQWDEAYFSATLDNSATFTALKVGDSTITYTLGDVTTTISVTIVEPILPETKQSSSFVWVAVAGTAIVLGAVIINGILKKKKIN